MRASIEDLKKMKKTYTKMLEQIDKAIELVEGDASEEEMATVIGKMALLYAELD